MKKTHDSGIYKLNICIVVSVLAIISFLWLLIYNRYHIIGHHEEMQLFRTDYLYFHSYVIRPGGLIDYLGAFFIQFYYYKWLGALIISLFLSLTFVLYIKICGRDNDTIYRLFIIPSIIFILLLMVSGDMYLHLTYILSICFALACMMIYLSVPLGTKRYITGFILYFVTYFVTGGNALLYVLLVIINELFNKERSFLYIGSLIVISIAIPYLAHLFIYVTLVKESYLAFTPFAIDFPNKTYTVAWLAIPLIYILSKYIGKKNWLQNTKPLKVLIPSYLVIILGLFYGMKSVSEPDMERIAEMSFYAEQGNWKKILEIRAKYPNLEKGDNLAAFYTNMALSELGLLSSQLFHYEQTVKENLFLNWTPTHFRPWYTGDQYYRLGIIQAAEHCAYEDMLANKRDYGSKALRRLVNTTLLRKDYKGFEKYINLFEKSPVYKDWAKQQKEYYEVVKIDPAFQIPETPSYRESSDFMLDYNSPDNDLLALLKNDRQNRKLFENLMAYLMLKKDMNTLILCMNEYYEGMGYAKMPRHYEEALLISRYVVKGMDNILDKYTISQETQKEFLEFTKTASTATNLTSKDFLKGLYGHTYWYYAMIYM